MVATLRAGSKVRDSGQQPRSVEGLKPYRVIFFNLQYSLAVNANSCRNLLH